MKIPDPRKVDRRLHSSYVKSMEYFGLHVYQNVIQYKDRQIVYYYERYCFIVDDTIRIYDWSLNASETDKMFQYAIKFYKNEEKRVNELKKSFTRDKKSGILTK